MCMHDTYQLNITPDKLRVDKTYQRDVNEQEVKKIVDDFKMDLFNPPKVSHRKDGYYYVFDGQHSMVAHKIVFGEDKPINCKVFEGLTYLEEVDLFVNQNGHSKPVNRNDQLKALYNDPASDVKSMVLAADTVGVIIDFKGGNYTNKISASSAAYNIFKLLGKDDFINVLYVIKRAWEGDAKAFTSGFLKGLAYVYKKYGQLVQNERIITALSKHTPEWYMRNASDLRGRLDLRYARLFVEAYNFKKVSNKLEPFWEVK